MFSAGFNRNGPGPRAGRQREYRSKVAGRDRLLHGLTAGRGAWDCARVRQRLSLRNPLHIRALSQPAKPMRPLVDVLHTPDPRQREHLSKELWPPWA